MKKFLSGAVVALLIAGGSVGVATAAHATAPAEECVPSEEVPGYWEDAPDITHPAVGEPKITVENPDYVPATEDTPAVWANFSPNDQKETFVGPPAYPTDERGTWYDHGQLPPGQAGPDGVYANGNPDKGGNWFYRQAAVEGTPEQGTPTIEVDNPDHKPSYVEITPDKWIDPKPAVTCDPEEESKTFNPSCTTVTNSVVRPFELVLSVDGNWGSSSTDFGFSGNTIADVGTVLDIQADPIQYVGLHVNTLRGSIVFEEEPSYGGKLWSSVEWPGVEPGMGYPAFGTIEEFIKLNGDVEVTDVLVLYTHPEASSTTIKSFTIGCTTYTYEPVIVPEKPADDVSIEIEEFVDCEDRTFNTTYTTIVIGTEYDAETNTWVALDPVVTVETEQRSATDEECPVTPAEPNEPEEPVTPTEPEQPTTPEKPSTPEEEVNETPASTEKNIEALAVTGSSEVIPYVFGGLALLVVGGVALSFVASRQRQSLAKAHDESTD